MRLLVTAVGVWLGFMAIIGGWCWVFSRRRRRRSNVSDSPVSPRWLNENVYRKDGDRP
jgi:LPXTG-motif cell wall-anchored protein